MPMLLRPPPLIYFIELTLPSHRNPKQVLISVFTFSIDGKSALVIRIQIWTSVGNVRNYKSREAEVDSFRMPTICA